MIVDLDPEGPTDVRLTSVSGEIAIRLPQPADAEVEANTASGTISNAFDGLRVRGQWGAHKVTGRLGAGTGKLRATTVSGSIALLRRPPREDEEEPWETDPFVKDVDTGTGPTDTADPVDGERGVSGDNPLSGQDDGPAPAGDPTDDLKDDPTDARTNDPTRGPADGTTDKKVL
jgi:hypothetical protein